MLRSIFFRAVAGGLMLGCLAATSRCGRNETVASGAGGLASESPKAAPADCPIAFVALQICGELRWTAGPTARGVSAFEVRFWDATAGRARPVAVELNVEFLMTCCGSPLAGKFSQRPGTEIGHFIVDGFKLSPNMTPDSRWEIHLLLKKGADREQQLATSLRV